MLIFWLPAVSSSYNFLECIRLGQFACKKYLAGKKEVGENSLAITSLKVKSGAEEPFASGDLCAN